MRVIENVLFSIVQFTSKRNFTGVNVGNILEMAGNARKNIKKPGEDVDDAINHITETRKIKEELSKSRKTRHQREKSITSRGIFISLFLTKQIHFAVHKPHAEWGTWLASMYLLTKLLYCVNLVLQFLIMNSFLGTRGGMWGFNVLKDIANGHEWDETGHFPRVTMCDFQVLKFVASIDDISACRSASLAIYTRGRCSVC